MKIKLTNLIIILLIIILSSPLNAVSQTKQPKACDPNICILRSKIPIQLKNLVGSAEGMISSPKLVASNFTLPAGGTALPKIKVLGNRSVSTTCFTDLQNKLRCIDEVQFAACPKDITIAKQLNSTQTQNYTCDLTCSSAGPNTATGLCECEPKNCR